MQVANDGNDTGTMGTTCLRGLAKHVPWKLFKVGEARVLRAVIPCGYHSDLEISLYLPDEPVPENIPS